MKKEKVTITGAVRVRYAPSPTGFLHIGNAQSALFNYLFARHYDGTWVLRIEDTDLKRNVAHGEQSQMENLHWLGLEWDEGPDRPNIEFEPYHQSKRVALYHKYVQLLLDKGIAYKDYTTEEELKKLHDEQVANKIAPHYDGRWYNATDEAIQQAEAEGRKPAIRLHLPSNHVYAWNDMIKGSVEFNSDNIGGDFIIEKSDGMATYNFAVVIDDYLMKITHVLRGDDHIANTPKQLAVYEALGISKPLFGHITLIYSLATHKKLSKRDKKTLQFISQYRKYGYLNEALVNFIALLGWSPIGEKEIFTLDELISNYDINRMSSSPAYFDQKKLDWTNGEYLKQLSLVEIADRIIELIKEAETTTAIELNHLGLQNDPNFIKRVVAIYQKEVKTLMAIMKKILFISQIEKYQFSYIDFEQLDPKKSATVLVELVDLLINLNNEVTDYHVLIDKIELKTGISGRELYFPLNITYTGHLSAPEVVEFMSLLPRTVLLKLTQNALRYLQHQ